MFFQRMGLKPAGAFCRRMGVGLRAGADLLRLLTSESNYGPPRQREAIAYVLDGVKQGGEISTLMKERRYFPKLMVTLTRVGEQTGKLERTFLTLAAHYENQAALRRQFLSSIAWPMIQLFLGLCVISIVIWIMGILTPAGGGEMIDILGFGLRGSSGVLIFWCYVGVVVAVLFGLYTAFMKNIGGVQNMVPIVYLVPKIGPSLQTITLSRFTRTLSLALGAGLDPIRSVKLSLDCTDSAYYQSGGLAFENAIRDRGDTMAGGLRSTDLFPDPFLQLVEVAELSGTESESIDHIADQYEEQARGAMRILSGVATGAIWVIVAGCLVFMIMRIAMVYIGGINDALQGL
ncbi:MAG: type II secretion system F family protein [Planctomycetota bacterium]